MRKSLLALIALAGLVGAGAVTSASASPAPAAGLVQTVQYYGGGYGYGPRAGEWREREWRRHEWWRHHRWEEHRWHEAYRGW